MKVKNIIFNLIAIMVGNLVLVSQVRAADGGIGKTIMSKLQITRGAAELPTTNDPVAVVGLVIQGLLSIVAIIFFILIFVAGFKWMLAGGNEETVANAKKSLKNAIIGLLVIVFSYVVTSVIFNLILGRPTV